MGQAPQQVYELGVGLTLKLSCGPKGPVREEILLLSELFAYTHGIFGLFLFHRYIGLNTFEPAGTFQSEHSCGWMHATSTHASFSSVVIFPRALGRFGYTCVARGAR